MSNNGERTEVYSQPEWEGLDIELAKKEEFLDSHFSQPFTGLWFKVVTVFLGMISAGTVIGIAAGMEPVAVGPLILVLSLVVWYLIYYRFRLFRKKRRGKAWDLISRAVRDQRNKGGVDVTKLAKNSEFSQGKVHEMLLDAVDSGVVQGGLNLR